MARRPRARAALDGGDVDPRGFHALLERYLEWMQIRAYSDETTEGREQFLSRFIRWCEERSVQRPGEVTKPIVERYQRHLYHCRKKDGRPLSLCTQYAHLVSVTEFFKWLCKQNHILFNPASEIDLPKVHARLPTVLTVAEVERVLGQAQVSTPLGVRDRAILETFYSTGMRRSEVMQLQLCDLDMDRGLVVVRQGKGRKDRVLPIGERALLWVAKYLDDVRPSLVVSRDEQAVFLTTRGEAFGRAHLSQLVHDYVEAAGIGKHGACHLLRHTMATLMLENGADIRFIQEMLGHETLSTTQVYTHVAIRALKQVHAATHPARLHRSTAEQTQIEEEDSTDDALFSALAAEADEEEHDR